MVTDSSRLPGEWGHRRAMLHTMWHSMGLGPRALPVSAGLLGLSLAGRTLSALQRPAARPPLRGPIFLAGAPRTGTTFLHRFLVELGVGEGLALGRMALPSPWVFDRLAAHADRLDALGPARFHDPRAHESGVEAVETEDAALLFRFLDGFLAYAFFGAWAEGGIAPDPADPTTTARDLDWLEALWRVRAADGGGRAVAKAASFGLRVPALVARFPDARVIYTVRDPAQLIPSALSLVQGALLRRFPQLASDADRRACHTAQLYVALVELLNRFAVAWQQPAFPREHVLLCAYPRLVGDLASQMHDLLRFVDVVPDAVGARLLQDRAHAQAGRVSQHRYRLAQYGLTASQVAADCAPYLDAFGGLLESAEAAR